MPAASRVLLGGWWRAWTHCKSLEEALLAAAQAFQATTLLSSPEPFVQTALWVSKCLHVSYYFCMCRTCFYLKELLEDFKISLAWWGWKGEDGRGLSHRQKPRKACRGSKSSTDGLVFTGCKACQQELRWRSKRNP